MKTLNYTNLFLSAITVLALSACGGASTSDNNTTNQPPVIEEMNEDAPVITLKGKNPLYRQHGRAYSEAGATALDDVDGDVEVKISGKVDVFKVGTYYITYTSQDYNGNVATVKRKVIVQPIIHHGLTYKPVVSPQTGRVWLDRNIGAERACKNDEDTKCFGDYYQWGRNTDGHEKLNSPTTTKKGATITDSGNKFVINHEDWTTDTHR